MADIWIMELRSRLAAPPPRRLPPREARQAAVLVPLLADAGDLWTVLTRRTRELPHHKGQIAFPGGTLEPGEDPWEAALREAEEEIGLHPRLVLRLGQLDEAETPSGFRIVPCVGAVPNDFEPRLQTDEIAEAFRLPLTAFANPQLVEDREVVLEGESRVLRVYHVGRRQIWGLTARVLGNLLDRLSLPVGSEN